MFRTFCIEVIVNRAIFLIKQIAARCDTKMANENEGIELLPTARAESEGNQGRPIDLNESESKKEVKVTGTDSNEPKAYKTNFEFIYGSGLNAWKTSRPWLTEFFDSAEFNLPDFSKLSRRVNENIAYFKSNYIVIGALCLAFAAFKNSFNFLLAVSFLYLIDRRASAVKETNPEKKFLYIFLAGFTLVITDILYDVMMAVFYASAFTVLHSSFHKTERDLPAPATSSTE